MKRAKAKQINIGIIGTGWPGQQHARVMSAIPDARLAAKGRDGQNADDRDPIGGGHHRTSKSILTSGVAGEVAKDFGTSEKQAMRKTLGLRSAARKMRSRGADVAKWQTQRT